MVLTLVVCCGQVATARPQDKLLNRPYADQKPLHLGFSVGMHMQDLKFTHNGFVTSDGETWFAEVPSYSPGFCVNVLGDWRLHKHFNLRLSPGMYFGNKVVKMLDTTNGGVAQQNVKTAYVVSLLLGAVGFASVYFIHDQHLLFISFLLIGAAWAAMLAIPFTLLTNSLSGNHIGTYLGLFNGTICLPQIVAAACGGMLLKMVGGSQASMFIIAGVLLVCGAAAVYLVKEKRV